MAKGRTGIEILAGWLTRQKAGPVEKQFHNPLDARIGSHVRLQNTLATVRGEADVDLGGQLFQVTEIWAWERSRHSDPLPPMTDYVLETEDKKLVLRVIQTFKRGKPADPGLLLLTQHWPESDDPHPWTEDDSPFVLDGCMDAKGELVRHLGTPRQEVYYRDLCNAHGQVSRIRDANGDGKVEADEVTREPYSLWAFRRDTADAVGRAFTQHLHVQLSGLYDEAAKAVSGGDKTILMLRGEELPARNLMLY